MILRIALSLAFLPVPLLGADFTVIKDGTISLVIENAQPDSAVTSYAARELQQTLQQMAAGEIAIAPLSASRENATPRIVIGAHAHLPAEARAALKLESGNTEEVLVQEHGGTLWITGPTERAALHATYTFLDAAGVRWLWPGEEGTRIPRPGEFIVRQEIRQVPDMAWRNLAISGKQDYDEELYTWLARNRQNMANITPWRPDETRAVIPRLQEKGFLLRMAGHSVVLPQAVLKKHPEYMALYSGERRVFHHHGAHLCWSNPDVQKALCEELIKWIDNFPEMDIASLYPNDHSYYCQCEGCVAMGPNISSRWHQLSKVLIKAMKEHRPDLQIWTLAYSQYRPAPVELAPYDHVQYTIYNASFRQPFSSGSPENAQALAAIEKWQKLGANVSLRQYEMIGLRNPNTFMPLVYFMADQFAYAKAHNLPGYSSEIIPIVYPAHLPPEERNWTTNRLNVYAAVRGMWDASLSAEQIVHDWAEHAYHAAAPAMEEYYHTLEKAWRHSPQPFTGLFSPSQSQVPGFISPTLITKAEAALKQAWELARSIDDPKERHAALAAIEIDERMFGAWRRLFRCGTPAGDPSIYRLLAGDDSAGVAAAPEAALVGAGGTATGEKAQMLWSDGALHVRWGSWHPLAIRVHSILTPGKVWEVAVDTHGKATMQRQQWETSEPVALLPEVTTGDDGSREVRIRFSELNEMVETFGRLYISLEGPNAARWPALPVAYGVLQKIDRPTPRLGFIDVRPEASSGVHQLSRMQGWESQRTTRDLAAVLPNADFTFINYGDGSGAPLNVTECRKYLKPYLEQGGIAMIYATQPAPVEKWLDDSTLSFRRVGEKPQDVLRRITTTTRAGDWLSAPNELKFWKTATTPYFGFAPKHPERWRHYATITMKDGQEVPWLTAAQVGKGWLIITSEPMGYGGYMSIFGDRWNERVGPFVENIMRDLAP